MSDHDKDMTNVATAFTRRLILSHKPVLRAEKSKVLVCHRNVISTE